MVITPGDTGLSFSNTNGAGRPAPIRKGLIMKKTINVSDFRDAFQSCRPDNFSYDGLGRLFDYFEEIDSEMELDVIAICCEWQEGTVAEALEEYNLESIEKLAEHTTVLLVDGDDSNGKDSRIIWQQF